MEIGHILQVGTVHLGAEQFMSVSLSSKEIEIAKSQCDVDRKSGTRYSSFQCPTLVWDNKNSCCFVCPARESQQCTILKVLLPLLSDGMRRILLQLRDENVFANTKEDD
jgi:hypothetical protein